MYFLEALHNNSGLLAIQNFKLGNPLNSYDKTHNVLFQAESVCITSKLPHKVCPQSFQWKYALLICQVQFGFAVLTGGGGNQITPAI